MNEVHGLTIENLLATLPKAIREDQSVYALASAVAEVLAARPAEIDTVRIYSRIDELAEEMLDILAYDFKVDWWDGNYSIEEKRRTLKDSWRVHRMLGTKAAVEMALSAVYPDTKVLEWFEYGGKPYRFRLEINLSESADLERHQRIIDRVNYYKNLRSHLDGIEYVIEAKEAATLRLGGLFVSVVKFYIPEIADEFCFGDTVYIGGPISAVATLPVPEHADEFQFDSTVHVGGPVSAIAALPIPVVPDDFSLESSIRAGGRTGAIASMNLPPVDDAIEFEQFGRIGGRMGSVASINLPPVVDVIDLKHTGRVGGRVANITTITMPNPQEP